MYNKAFTLIELLVVIFIISLLSSVLFLSTRQADAKAALSRTAFQLAQDLRSAQEMAMGAESVDCGWLQSKSFGVNFQKISGTWEQKYTIFSDCDNDNQYDNASDVAVREAEFEEGVIICSISAPAGANFNAVFIPPDPLVFLNNTANGEAVIQLCLSSDISQVKNVKINTVGKIEITN